MNYASDHYRKRGAATRRQHGAGIRSLREQRGIRTGEFAAAVGVKLTSLVSVENCHDQASWILLYKIAAELDVEITDILSTEGRQELAARQVEAS